MEAVVVRSSAEEETTVVEIIVVGDVGAVAFVVVDAAAASIGGVDDFFAVDDAEADEGNNDASSTVDACCCDDICVVVGVSSGLIDATVLSAICCILRCPAATRGDDEVELSEAEESFPNGVVAASARTANKSIEAFRPADVEEGGPSRFTLPPVGRV